MRRQPPQPPRNGSLFVLTVIAVAAATALMVVTPGIIPVNSSEVHGFFDHLGEIATRVVNAFKGSAAPQ